MKGKNNIPHRILLTEKEMPRQWYNVIADMKIKPAPLLNPGTGAPVTQEELAHIFGAELCRQELSTEAFIDIPEEVLSYYKIYRPSPVSRAYHLERALGTPARIYYKYEGANTSGSHKLNSAVPQVYYNKVEGTSRLTTETGAGQWGTALAMACAHYDMPLTVFMVKSSYLQKPDRRSIMEVYGATVHASPSGETAVGRSILEATPDNLGSLGTAISEAIETTMTGGGRYALGSVLNHVVLHQSIIGQEARQQMLSVDEYPDVIIGCAGGGSNFGGLIAPFVRDKLRGDYNPHLIAVEPRACPSFTRGKFAYDFCDVGHVTPLAKMYTLGSSFMPASIHAGGLRYHGMSPILSQLYHDGVVDEARAVFQRDVFEAATMFARLETILPAPESAHAIRTAIDVALECKKTGEEKVILFGLTGNGSYDLKSYLSYQDGTMQDFEPTEEELAQGFAGIPAIG